MTLSLAPDLSIFDGAVTVTVQPYTEGTAVPGASRNQNGVLGAAFTATAVKGNLTREEYVAATQTRGAGHGVAFASNLSAYRIDATPFPSPPRPGWLVTGGATTYRVITVKHMLLRQVYRCIVEVAGA
jgi:hypothetical protein